jgi:hypothetical protein
VESEDSKLRKRKLKGELSCIGILLDYCSTDCSQCWFATEKQQPTLVRIETFKKVQEMRLVVPDVTDTRPRLTNSRKG